MRKAIALSLVAMMILGMPAGSVAAGAAAGGIAGTARDMRGGRLVNAGVRVRNASRGHVVLETRTGAAGQFSAPNLQPGIYIIEALGLAGQVVGVSPTVSVIAGRTATANVTAAAAQAPPAAPAGFSLFGLGTAASIGIVAAAAAAAVTTIAVVANDDSVASPSQ